MSQQLSSVVIDDLEMAPPEALVGTELGHYRVDALLSQGGMGAVYVGTHLLLARRVAIKTLLPHVSADADAVRRFFNEARATSAISHPGIVQIFDFGRRPSGLAYIAMELLEGETLGARIQRGPAPEAEALSLVRQASAALVAAHAIGVVHRDLKPSNMFLTPDPEAPGAVRVKLLDFGIAKLLGDGAGKQLGAAQHTETGTFLGTPAYMSPEQCRGVAVDHRTDIYALGCVLYELLSGQRAFVGETAGDLIVAHIARPAPSLAEVVPDASPAVATLVADLLRRNPADRPATCEALLARIDACVAAGLRAAPARVRAATPRPLSLDGTTERTELVATPQVRIGTGATRSAAFAATIPSSEETAPVRRTGGPSRWKLVAAAATVGLGAIAAAWWLRGGPERRAAVAPLPPVSSASPSTASGSAGAPTLANGSATAPHVPDTLRGPTPPPLAPTTADVAASAAGSGSAASTKPEGKKPAGSPVTSTGGKSGGKNGSGGATTTTTTTTKPSGSGDGKRVSADGAVVPDDYP